MSTPTVFTVITTKLNAGQNAANTGAGTQNPDGSFNTLGTVLGTAQTVHAGIELATLGKKVVGTTMPLTGLGLSAASAAVAADKIQKDWSTGKPINQSDLAQLVGGVAGMGSSVGAVIILVGAGGPIVVTLAAAATVTSVAAGGYQLYAAAKGLTVDGTTGRTVEVALTPAQMAQIDQHMQQTMPLWNQTSTLPELGFVTGTKVQTVGSVFSAAASNTNNAPAATGLDTPTRNSSALINTTGANTTQFNSGGGVDDLWVVEKNAGRYVGTREQFRADFVASNGQVNPKTLVVQQGQNYYVPQRSANGNTVYHYTSGAKVMNNAVTGEYLMEVPNTDGSGGKTVYSRTADDVGYTVKQVQTNAAGAVVFEHQSYQNTLDADLSPVSTRSVSGNETTTRNWLANNVYQTDTFMGPPAPNTSPSTSSLNFGSVNYNLFDFGQRSSAEYQLKQLNQSGGLSNNSWSSFTSGTSNWLLGGGTGLTPGGGSYGLQPPASWLNPIGAFYDSQSAAFDNAVSIANKMPAAAATHAASALPTANNDRTQQATDNTMRRKVSANLPIWKEAA